MKTRDELLRAWRDVLTFRIGDGGIVALDQIPNFFNFPLRLPCDTKDGESWAADALGYVLSWAFFKQHHLVGMAVSDSLEGGVGIKIRCLLELDSLLQRLPKRYAKEVKAGFLSSVEELVRAVFAPTNEVRGIVWSIDNLTNADLHDAAMRAIQGQPVRLKGLYS